MPNPDNTLSTRHLQTIPEIESLRQELQGMAALTSIIAIDNGETPYEFHPAWSNGEQMGAYKSGSGDEVFVHFTPAGCFIKGFAHESAMSPYQFQPPELWPGLLDDVPQTFAESLAEPAFDMQHTTFLIWRQLSDKSWHTANVQHTKDFYGDGSQDLLPQIVTSPSAFAEWLAENYEVEVDAEIVEHVFAQRPLTAAHLKALNPDAKLAALREAVQETGYPLA